MSDDKNTQGHAFVHISPSDCMGALTPKGSIVSILVSIATGELHLRGSLGLKDKYKFIKHFKVSTLTEIIYSRNCNTADRKTDPQ